MDEMSKPLSIMFEEPWQSGEVPSDWHGAKNLVTFETIASAL